MRPICVHDLLAHTSGIGFGPGFGYEPENAYEISYVPLVRKAGSIEFGVWEFQVDSIDHPFSHVDISKNWGTPKSSILIGFSTVNHPFSGTPIFGNTHVASGYPG